jgi:hypothetical protein
VSVIFYIPPTLGTLSILHPLDPSVLLVLILGGVSCGLIGRDVCKLLVVILGTQLVLIRVAKGDNVDLTIW